MASTSDASQDEVWAVSISRFRVIMWTLCGIATLFLVSRFAVRMSTKGRLMVNDYFLVVALLVFYIGAGLLQSTLKRLYLHEEMKSITHHGHISQQNQAASCLVAAIEMLWIAIYCVKFCFLAQFKFYKPPYNLVSVYLTRYYWTAIGLCAVAFLFSLIQPIVLCSAAENCRYFQTTNTVVLETLITALDIMADLLVISIPVLLICMAHFTHSQTIINVSFKCLSIVALAIAATRLAIQHDSRNQRVNYVSTVFLLVVEAAVAIIMASISSYRVLVIDHLAERRMKRGNEEQRKTRKFETSPRLTSLRNGTRLSVYDSDALVDSLSELPMIHIARTVPVEGAP